MYTTWSYKKSCDFFLQGEVIISAPSACGSALSGELGGRAFWMLWDGWALS